MVWFSYFSLSSSINLFFFIFFYRAETGFELLGLWMIVFLVFLADFFSVFSCLIFLSIFKTSLSFLKTYLLAVCGIYFLAVVFREVTACLFYFTTSEILLDFFLLDFRGLADSTVGLLLNFLDYFLINSFGCSMWLVLMMVDLLLLPNPPLLGLGLNFLWDMLIRGYSYFYS